MDKGLELLVKQFSEGNYYVVIAIVLFFVVANYQRFSNLLLDHKRVKIELLEKSLAESNVQGLTKEYLKSQIETEYFHAATGLRMDRKFREIVIDTYNRSDGDVRFEHFRRAKDYYIFKDNKLFIKLSFLNWISFVYNIFFSVIFFLGFVIAMFTPVFIEEKTLENTLPIYGLGLTLFVAALVFLLVSLPYISAMYVKGALLDSESRVVEEEESRDIVEVTDR